MLRLIRSACRRCGRPSHRPRARCARGAAGHCIGQGRGERGRAHFKRLAAQVVAEGAVQPYVPAAKVAAASVSSGRLLDPATGSSPNSCSCARSVRARRSTACRVWSRIACSPAGMAATSDCGRLCFCDGGFCQRADAVKNLPGIEAALAGEQLPVPPLEVIAPTFAGDFLCEVLRDVLPNLAAHDVVHRRKRRAVAADHDRVVLGMSVGVAGENIDHDHIEQTHDIGRGHVPPRYLKHVLQGRSTNSGLVGFVLGGWRLPERLAIILLVQATPTAADISSVVSLARANRFVCRLGRS